MDINVTLKIVFKNKTIEMNETEAKELYWLLNGMFGKQTEYIPYTPVYPVYPLPRPNPYVYPYPYTTCSGQLSFNSTGTINDNCN